MNPSTQVVSPLRQRMIEDMRLRKLNGKTQIAYVRAVRRLAGFLRRSPDTATGEDLRRFQLHMVDQGTSSMTINATISGLRFLFEITLERGELMAMMSPVREPRRLPVVLSREEVARLIAAARNPKHRAALSVAYGAGLRASEVVSLKVGDIDSERMTLRVEQGKGRKDRYAMLSPLLLERLRAWWRVAHAEGKMLPNGWLFPGLDPIDRAQEVGNDGTLYTSRHRDPAQSGFSDRGVARALERRRGAARPRGRRHLPYPWASLAPSSAWAPEPGPAQSHVGHRAVPQRGAGGTCAAL
jgi:integrase/recombinase XerD